MSDMPKVAWLSRPDEHGGGKYCDTAESGEGFKHPYVPREVADALADAVDALRVWQELHGGEHVTNLHEFWILIQHLHDAHRAYREKRGTP